MTSSSFHPHHGGNRGSKNAPHVVDLVNEAISKLAPFAALILTITLVIFFLVRFYLFESWLMLKYKCYRGLSDINRRGFVNHHIAGIAKIIMAVSGVYPFFSIVFGKATVHTPFAGSNVVTLGDVLIVVNQLFIAMYIFELLYRAKLSPVAIMHHVGAIVIAQSAVAISLNWEHERDAMIEFMLCFVWGFFDIVAEFWPHVAIIQYRMWPKEHAFLTKLFRFCCISTFAGTIIETITVMWLFGSLWHRWSLSFKVVTPLLHVVFSAAQLWGAWNFRSMWLKHKKLAEGKNKEDEERNISSSGSGESGAVTVAQDELPRPVNAA